MDLYNNLYSNRPATEGTPVSVRPIEEIGWGDAGPGAYQPSWHGPTNTILGERLPFDDGSGGGSGDANEEFLLAYAGATPGTAAMLGLVAAGGLPAAGSPFGRLAETFTRLKDDVVTQWDDLKNIDPDTKKRLISLGWDLTQFGLDIAGIFDPFGVADGANTIISLVRRDWLGASLSATGMLVPYLGDLAKAGKFGKYVASLNEAIELAGKSKQIRKLMIPIFQGLDEVIDAAKKVPYSQIEEKALAVYELYAKAEPRLRLLFLAMGTTPQAVTKTAYDEMMGHLDDAQRQIDEFLGAVATRNPAWRQSDPDSQALARNLGIEPGSGLDAHHIVAGTHGRAAGARALLDHYQIDINAAENGVPLVGGLGAPQNTLPRHHRGGGLHSHAGIDAVTRRLQLAIKDVDEWATGRQALIDELAAIRREIQDGTFP